MIAPRAAPRHPPRGRRDSARQPPRQSGPSPFSFPAGITRSNSSLFRMSFTLQEPREVLKRPRSVTSVIRPQQACQSCSTAVKIASPRSAAGEAVSCHRKRFHPSVPERHTLMNSERARKHSLIAQFVVHVETNISFVVCRKYNDGVARAPILLGSIIASFQRKIVRINRTIQENDARIVRTIDPAIIQLRKYQMFWTCYVTVNSDMQMQSAYTL